MKNYKSKKILKKEKALKKKRISYLFMFLVLVFSFYTYRCGYEKMCYVSTIDKIVRHNYNVVTPNGVIKAEVVDTDASRELGLSGRDNLNPNEGMLFVFDKPGRYGFWMKDMKFPLDIIWINKDGVVVTIERNFTAESYLENPPKTVVNTPSASYVLEINKGRADELGIFLGTKVKIEK